MNPRDWLSWLPAVALAAVVVAAPLPFGGVVPWAAAALEVAAFLLLALALLGTPELRRAKVVTWPAVALAGLALFGFLQSLPLPEAVVKVLSPEQVRLRAEVAAALPLELVPPPPALSVAPEVSRAVALRFAAFAALLLASALVGARRRHRRLLALAAGAAVVAQLVIGYRSWMAGSKLIWDTLVSTDTRRLHGTFVNPNHFALYLELALALALAWLWWSWRRSRELPKLESRVLLTGPPLVVWLGLFVSLAFTASRAGLLAAIAGTLVQAMLLLRLSRHRLRSTLAVGALALSGFAAVAWIGWQQGFGRWLSASSAAGLAERGQVYRAAFELWQRFPFFGTGLGTFRESFGLVQPATVPAAWWHAHSDWLELPVTAGLPGLALVLLGLALLVRRLAKVLSQGRRSEDRAAALAAFGALAATAVHELVDFGLTMPANAATLAVIAGAACGAIAEHSSRLATVVEPVRARREPAVKGTDLKTFVSSSGSRTP